MTSLKLNIPCKFVKEPELERARRDATVVMEADSFTSFLSAGNLYVRFYRNIYIQIPVSDELKKVKKLHEKDLTTNTEHEVVIYEFQRSSVCIKYVDWGTKEQLEIVEM